MATVIFDFDSTLIAVESLEEILASILEDRPQTMAAIEAVTAQGMAGECSFAESLSQRLNLASPNLSQVRAFGERAMRWLTPGLAALIHNLRGKGVDVAIVSGGLREAILPLARHLGLADEAVHAVRLLWDEHGGFAGIDPKDPFSRSKVEGLTEAQPNWQRPVIAVGDGMTDFELYRQGIADHFVAFTRHVKRDAVTAAAPAVAATVKELESELELWL